MATEVLPLSLMILNLNSVSSSIIHNSAQIARDHMEAIMESAEEKKTENKTSKVKVAECKSQQKRIDELCEAAGMTQSFLDEKMNCVTKTIKTVIKKYNEAEIDHEISFKKTISKKLNPKEILECLTFGYVREQIEDISDFIFPYYLKMLCLQFYGHMIMNSNILDVNQMNTIQYVLNSELKKKDFPQFYFQRIYDSYRSEENDAFDSKIFASKCNHLTNSLIIMRTKGGFILSCYFVKALGQIVTITNSAGSSFIQCLLQSPTKTVPILYHNFGKIYHFPNCFEANKHDKLCDVVIEYDVNKAVKDIEWRLNNKTDINDIFLISEFEVFI